MQEKNLEVQAWISTQNLEVQEITKICGFSSLQPVTSVQKAYKGFSCEWAWWWLMNCGTVKGTSLQATAPFGTWPLTSCPWESERAENWVPAKAAGWGVSRRPILWDRSQLTSFFVRWETHNQCYLISKTARKIQRDVIFWCMCEQNMSNEI